MYRNRVNLSVEQHIAHVTLARAEKMNALDADMFEAIIECGEAIANDKHVRVVVLNGDGDAFCAGIDKANFSLAQESSDQNNVLHTPLAERTHGIANIFQHVVWLWRELPVPVIAALHGVALGGGLQIALGADIRIAHPKTRFSIMELKWGIIPDMSSSQILRHLVAEDIVRELTYTARIFTAEEAKSYSIVTHLDDDPLAAAMNIARQIAGRNPEAVQAAKKVFNQAPYLSAEQGLIMESAEQEKILGSANQIEAVMAELQKRKANFS